MAEDDRRDQNAQCPDVRRHRVRVVLHKNLRRSVSQRVDWERHAIGSGNNLSRETEIGQKNVVIVCHQEIIQFDVAVNNITTMKEVKYFHNLVNIDTKNLGRKTAVIRPQNKLRWE